jgi:hypothetical protein
MTSKGIGISAALVVFAANALGIGLGAGAGATATSLASDRGSNAMPGISLLHLTTAAFSGEGTAAVAAGPEGDEGPNTTEI